MNLSRIYIFYPRDNAININEFTAICKALFRNEKGKPYKYVFKGSLVV